LQSTVEQSLAYYNCFSSSQKLTRLNVEQQSTWVQQTQLSAQLKHCYLIWENETTVQALSLSPRKEKAATFRAAFQSIMEALKLKKRHYNTHSFRIGAATSASLANISDIHIQMLGHWKSNAFQRYIRPPPTEIAKLSKWLATGER